MGVNTKETLLDPKLVNRFDYDGIYGTVLNGFISRCKWVPLTVYGTGNNVRSFTYPILQNDKLAVENPPSKDKVRILTVS